jgi:hypothetical protein
MLMSTKPPVNTGPRWADNSHGWPALAGMMAPSAGCDCQMLALVIADSMEAAREAGPDAAPKMTEQ